jgi:hypothetical protein
MAEPLLVAAPILNIQIFLLGIFGLLALLVAVSALHRHPTRVCPQCGQKVRLDHGRCPTCRYRFSHFFWR